MMHILTRNDLLPECREFQPFMIHLEDFNISDNTKNFYNEIVFQDEKGYQHILKKRGCVRKRKNRRIKKRSLKFKNS